MDSVRQNWQEEYDLDTIEKQDAAMKIPTENSQAKSYLRVGRFDTTCPQQEVAIRGSGKIWRDVSIFTARSAMPSTAASGVHATTAGKIEQGTLVASRRVCFRSFWVIYFMFLFSFKRMYLKGYFPEFTMNSGWWCQNRNYTKCTHGSSRLSSRANREFSSAST